MPSVNVVRKGIIIGSGINLSQGLGAFSMRWKLSRSSRLLAMNIRVVGTPQIVFISNNDYSCIENYRHTIDELNNYWRVHKYKC